MARRRQRPELVAWRKLVYLRDNWQCQWPQCGLGVRTVPFRKIEAHHIKTWKRYPELRLRVNNGITLCLEHHEAVTGCEDKYILFFQKILRKSGKIWTYPKEAAAKRRMLRYLLGARFRKRARSAGGRFRRKRS